MSNLSPKWVGKLLNWLTNKDYFFYEDKTVTQMNNLVFGQDNNEIKGIVNG